jgi:serine/threonine protein kinase/nitrite reductase/ring-hydroxylating ferredoxin subunit
MNSERKDREMQTVSVDELVGRTLGEYRIERLLGHGQLGAAYMAQQLSQGRTVIITMFNFPEGISAQERERFTTRLAKERTTLARLTHPYILPIYDFDEHSGYLYLVTAFVKGASLGQVLKQQGRFTPQQTLEVLKQVATGLDYAHSNGVVHGILSLSNVLMSNELTVQIAGFGLRTMLEVHGYTQNIHLNAHLFRANGTFPGSPEYISPERVLGMPTDARSDIYALGVMLFELLSGTLPFSGANPLDTALKRLQQPVPSVHAVCPDVPEAFDLLISKTLERDPANRYQRASGIVTAFERVLTTLETMQKATNSRNQQLAQGPQLTLPPTVNWFEEAGIPAEKWQLLPPIVTGRMPAVIPSSSEKPTWMVAGSGEMHPSAIVQPDSPTEMVPAKETLPPPAGSRGDSMAGVDPFAWWSATSDRPGTPPPAPGTFTQRSRRKPAQQDRRKLVKLMAVGTAGVLTVSGISFSHFIQSMKQSQIANVPTARSTAPATTQGNTPTVGTTKGAQKTPTTSKSPTAKPSPSATKAPQSSPTAQPTQQPTQQPTPTQPPAPTPTPPGHTGTVIGYTNQATNSAKSFTNPADGNAGLLIHLGNGNFVACERACTHAGVPVNYDSGSGKLVCPAHGATFNADGTNPTSPAPSPLPQVSIRVNGDGTITTG